GYFAQSCPPWHSNPHAAQQRCTHLSSFGRLLRSRSTADTENRGRSSHLRTSLARQVDGRYHGRRGRLAGRNGCQTRRGGVSVATLELLSGKTFFSRSNHQRHRWSASVGERQRNAGNQEACP